MPILGIFKSFYMYLLICNSFILLSIFKYLVEFKHQKGIYYLHFNCMIKISCTSTWTFCILVKDIFVEIGLNRLKIHAKIRHVQTAVIIGLLCCELSV